MSKGSRRRPTKVPLEVADKNFETIFGKYVPTYLRKQIPDQQQKEETKEPKDKE